MNATGPGACYRRARRAALCTSWGLVWAITAGSISAAQIALAQESEGQTRFQRTVQYLQNASPELRGDFAAIALTNLADAYIAEATLAREEARATGHDANLRGWSVMVDYFARQMPMLLQDIELGLPVRLTIGGDKSLAINVADRIVIVSPPRLNQQGAFEEAILAEFCAKHSCEQFSPGSAERELIPFATASVRPDWSFTAQESVCSCQGIKVRFKNEQNLANSRLICEQFLHEVTALTDQLAWQQRHGVSIEWDNLDIQSTPHRPEHMVRLNAIGDSVLVTVPVLYSSPDLLRHIVPWMRQRLSSQTEVSVELDAEHYGWQKP
jgi:hypothetical protein